MRHTPFNLLRQSYNSLIKSPTLLTYSGAAKTQNHRWCFWRPCRVTFYLFNPIQKLWTEVIIGFLNRYSGSPLSLPALKFLPNFIQLRQGINISKKHVCPKNDGSKSIAPLERTIAEFWIFKYIPKTSNIVSIYVTMSYKVG